MTASTTATKRRCGCGQFKETHENGTLKRHTVTRKGANIVRCPFGGKFPPAIAKMRFDVNTRDVRANRPKTYTNVQIQDKPASKRGGHRAAKNGLKARYRRNAAGGHNQ